MPRNESIVYKRSHCESCKKTLSWYDLIPFLSFIFLKGRCRYCNVSLSLQYPVVELLTGILFIGVIGWIGEIRGIREIGTLGYYLFMVSSLIAIFFIDLKNGIIPDKILYPAIIFSVAYLLIIPNSLFLIHVFSAFGSFLFFLLIFLATKGRGMGFGDVKFVFLIGLMLGSPQIIIALYIAFLTGAITSLILVLWRKKKFKGGTVPFGPFLVVGTLISLFFGKIILEQLMLVLHL